MPSDNGKILPGLPSRPAIRQFTAEEKRYIEMIEKHRDLVLRDLRPLSEYHKMHVLKEVVCEILLRDFAQGSKGAAFKLFVQQISDGMSNRKGTSIDGLLEPGKIGGGIKR